MDEIINYANDPIREASRFLDEFDEATGEVYVDYVDIDEASERLNGLLNNPAAPGGEYALQSLKASYGNRRGLISRTIAQIIASDKLIMPKRWEASSEPIRTLLGAAAFIDLGEYQARDFLSAKGRNLADSEEVVAIKHLLTNLTEVGKSGGESK